MTLTRDGMRTPAQMVLGLAAQILPGARAEQQGRGDYRLRRPGRAGDCFDPNCSGCDTCTILVRPLADAIAWLQRYARSFDCEYDPETGEVK